MARSNWRVACVRVPGFALGASWSGRHTRDAAGLGPAGDAAWPSRPIALVRDGRVMDVTAAARRAAGPGGRAARVGHHGPAVELVEWDPLAIESAVVQGTARLLDASAQVTPVAGAPGLWWAGVGSPDQSGGGERGVARALARIARRWHPRARVAVASSCVAARVAVWGDDAPGAPPPAPAIAAGAPLDGVWLVPRGECAAFIAAAPLGFLPMDVLLRQALLGAGVRTVGALAALAPDTVAQRWGAAGTAAWRLACGDDARRPVLAADAARRTASAELATPTDSPAPVLALVRAALERLTAQLAAEGRLAAAVAITLTLDDGRGAQPAGGLAHTVTRELRLPCPLGGAGQIYPRCRALLDRWAPPARVCAVRLEVTATAPARPPAALVRVER